MKMKKVVSSLLVAAMAASLLAGCGGSNDQATTDSAPADTTSESSSADTDTEPADTTEASTEDTSDDAEPAAEQTLKVAAFEGGYGADMWSEFHFHKKPSLCLGYFERIQVCGDMVLF